MKGRMVRRVTALFLALVMTVTITPTSVVKRAYAATSPELQKIYELVKAETDKENEKEYIKGNFYYDVSVEDDTLTISVVADSEYYKESEGKAFFNYNDGYITFSSSENDYTTYMFFSAFIVGAVEKSVGLKDGILTKYVDTLFLLAGEDAKEIKDEYYEMSAPDEHGISDYKLYALKYDEAKLNSVVSSVYFDEHTIKYYSTIEELGDMTLSGFAQAGNYLLSYNARNKYDVKITLETTGGLDDKSIASIKNIVAALKPVGYEDFAASYNGTSSDEKEGRNWNVYVPTAEQLSDEFGDHEVDTAKNGYVQVVFVNPYISLGETHEMKAGEFDFAWVENATVKSYKSSDKKVATVDKDGMVVALKKGTATVTATLDDGSVLTSTVKVTTSPTIKVAGKKYSKSKTYTVKKGSTLSVKITGKASQVNNKYKSSKSKVAKVTSKKTADTVKIKGLKKGKSTVTLTVNGVSYKIKVKVK